MVKHVKTVHEDIWDIIDKYVSSENDEILYGLDRAAAHIIEYFEEKNAAKDAKIAKLQDALKEIESMDGEINPSNYDYDDVIYLNDQFCKSAFIARSALNGDK